MALTRRGFVQAAGIGAAGAFAHGWIGARGRENALWSAVEPTLHAVESGLIVLAAFEVQTGELDQTNGHLRVVAAERFLPDADGALV